jgi:hypothetical protein
MSVCIADEARERQSEEHRREQTEWTAQVELNREQGANQATDHADRQAEVEALAGDDRRHHGEDEDAVHAETDE